MAKPVFESVPEPTLLQLDDGDELITVYEARAITGVSKAEFTRWYHTGTLKGIKHPAFTHGSNAQSLGAHRKYSRKDSERAAAEIQAAMPDRLLPEVWTRTEALAFGINEMLGAAMRNPITLCGGGVCVTIRADEPTGDAEPARKYLPHLKPVRELLKAGRIKSASYPNAEFVIEEK